MSVSEATRQERIAKLPNLLPFYLCYINVALFALNAYLGGFWFIPLFVFNFYMLGTLDIFVDLYEKNADPATETRDLFWYRLVTILWFPTQLLISFGGLYYTLRIADHAAWESWMIMVSAGVLLGGMGITFAHEMMHQKPRLERWFADGLMCIALYGHFRSEHIKVHHRYVATPRDTVTARYGEGFYRFFLRVLPEGFASAWGAEKEHLKKRGRLVWHLSNPFWIYGVLSSAFLAVAYWIGGLFGVLIFVNSAFVAVLLLEVINYVEHYGLTREYLGDGKYEQVRPRHSWNASHKYTNFLLVNLQRHSDHHYSPSRRFPLLQTYSEEEAPQLPYGYPIMVMAALYPRMWKFRMNKRVREWRKTFYPHIDDWTDYNTGNNPQPR